MGVGSINVGAGFGGGGVQITQQVASQLSSLLAIAITQNSSQAAFVPGQATAGPYRPIGWANNDPKGQKARYSLSYAIPATTQTNAAANSSATGSSPDDAYVLQGAPATSYAVFDAVLRGNISSRLKITDYPVQTGQNFSYNAVLEPVRIVLEVGVYDTVAAYDISMWGGASIKSVAALKLMQLLQQLRVPITINSRWGTFYPMLLEDVTLPDDQTTYAVAKMTLTFRQVFVASLTPQGQSARTQTTDDTSMGTVSSTPVPDSVTTNNMQTPAQQAQQQSAQIVPNNSGPVSSNPNSTIPALPVNLPSWFGINGGS